MLLTSYRDANRAARTEPEPSYFASAYKVERLMPVLRTEEEWDDKVLGTRIQSAQAELSEQIRQIGDEFERAVEKYRQLDNLFPESTLGATQAA